MMFSTQFLSVGLIALLGAMSPGPDFAIVTKNSLLHSRQAGLWTTLGVGAAILVHLSYCMLGLAVLLSSSVLVFNIIKYLGALYLIYLGLRSLFYQHSKALFAGMQGKKREQGKTKSFMQGFWCNLLNPKAALFFLSLFTVLIKPDTPFFIQLIYALEIALMAVLWFSLLTVILSQARIKKVLERAEQYIVRALGVALIVFGVLLAFAKMN